MARRDVTEFERLYSEALTLAGGLEGVPDFVEGWDGGLSSSYATFSC